MELQRQIDLIFRLANRYFELPRDKRLQRKVELISNSADRMMRVLELPRDKRWWWFMRRESWIHLKRSWELWWMVLRRKE